LAVQWAHKSDDIDTEVAALIKLSQVLPHIETEGALLHALGALNQAVTRAPNNIDVRKARLELQYDLSRDTRNLRVWQNVQQYADDLIEVIKSYPEQNLDAEDARAHYLRGLATLSIVEILRATPQDMLEARQKALQFFQEACKYDPNSVDYCKAAAPSVSMCGST